MIITDGPDYLKHQLLFSICLSRSLSLAGGRAIAFDGQALLGQVFLLLAVLEIWM
jgi:hypothetical protein